MTLKEKISRGSLIFLVVLSLILSYIIWMSPLKTPEKEDNTTVNPTVTSQRQGKDASEIFLPNKLVWHNDNTRLYTAREALLMKVQKKINKGEYKGLTLLADKDLENFQKVLASSNGVELAYIGSFLLKEYVTVNHLAINTKGVSDDFLFNRLFLDFTDNKLYFLADKEHTVYASEGKVTEDSYLNLLEDSENHFIKVSNNHDILPEKYYVETEFSLPKYSYIVGTQPYTTFTRAFFKKSQDLSISDNGQDLVYYNNQQESLSIENESGKVLFTSKEPITNKEVETNLFKEGFSYVSSLGSQLGNLRFFDNTKQLLRFTTFVEGYPIFSKEEKGQLQVHFINEDTLQLITNVQGIQIPIPTEEEVTLENTQTLLQSIATAKGNMSLISNFQIGYQWEDVEETSQVVNLIPQWFVKYNHHWYSKAELLQKLKEGGV